MNIHVFLQIFVIYYQLVAVFHANTCSWRVLRCQRLDETFQSSQNSSKKQTQESTATKDDWGQGADDWGVDSNNWDDVSEDFEHADAANTLGLNEDHDMIISSLTSDLNQNMDTCTAATVAATSSHVPGAIVGSDNSSECSKHLTSQSDATDDTHVHPDSSSIASAIDKLCINKAKSLPRGSCPSNCLLSYYINVFEEPCESAESFSHEQKLLQEYALSTGEDMEQLLTSRSLEKRLICCYVKAK